MYRTVEDLEPPDFNPHASVLSLFVTRAEGSSLFLHLNVGDSSLRSERQTRVLFPQPLLQSAPNFIGLAPVNRRSGMAFVSRREHVRISREKNVCEIIETP